MNDEHKFCVITKDNRLSTKCIVKYVLPPFLSFLYDVAKPVTPSVKLTSVQSVTTPPVTTDVIAELFKVVNPSG